MPSPTRASHIGLNAANFFLAELGGVVLPFLGTFLKGRGWSYDQIGCAVAVSGMGVLIFQVPAGVICDEVKRGRLLLGATSIIFGASYAVLPLLAGSHTGVNSLLFIGGAASAFFVPLLAALALCLAGLAGFDRIMGANQAWNHAGNIAAALMSLALVKFAGVTSVFYVMAVVSFLAAASLTLIRPKDLRGRSEKSHTSFKAFLKTLRTMFADRRIIVLVISVTLFHIANAPTMPLVALYLKELGAGDDKTAWVVLIAQATMVPVALLCAHYCEHIGRKPVFAVAFIVLPLRIALYAMTKNPAMLLTIQALDGIGAGIYGVVICLICGDVTRGKGGFNTLLGVCQTALALGAVVGPMLQGYVTQHLGFPLTFVTLAAIAAAGALLFITSMPETKSPT